MPTAAAAAAAAQEAMAAASRGSGRWRSMAFSTQAASSAPKVSGGGKAGGDMLQRELSTATSRCSIRSMDL